MSNRNEVKALLARAGVEISDTLSNIDKMNDAELASAAKFAGDLRAFFDFNGSCGSVTPGNLKAFFDFNGSCGATSLDTAIKRVVKLNPRRG